MNKRILVVEDQEDNRQILRDLLGSIDIDMIEAHDGQAAVTQAAAHKPDLILMDIQLPIMDGYEATRRIRQSAGDRDIPIIAMTANAMEGDRDACLAVGMNDYVSKPMRIQNLVTVIDRLMPLVEERRAFKTNRPDHTGGI